MATVKSNEIFTMKTIKNLARVKIRLTFLLSKVPLFWLISASRFALIIPRQNLKIITGADSSHSKSLMNLLDSVFLFENSAEVSVWDLGLTESERVELHRRFPEIELKKFKFEGYPDYFNIKVNAGEYAWKPEIIFQEAQDSNSLLLWLDAGNKLTGKLTWIRKFIKADGYYSPYSTGTIIDWTHKSMLEKFNLDRKFYFRPNLNGAIVGFDPDSEVGKNLLTKWRSCANDKFCIAPEGSNRSNHRQDQSALTCLAYSGNIVPLKMFRVIRPWLKIKIHQDID